MQFQQIEEIWSRFILVKYIDYWGIVRKLTSNLISYVVLIAPLLCTSRLEPTINPFMKPITSKIT